MRVANSEILIKISINLFEVSKKINMKSKILLITFLCIHIVVK